MITYEIWDKKSKINGISAKKILTDERYKNTDAILLIKKDNVVVQIQAYNPDLSGNIPLTIKQATELGEKTCQQLN